MAIQVIPSSSSAGENMGSALGSALGLYAGYKLSKNKEKKLEKKKKKEEDKISAALQTEEGFTKDKADKWAASGEKTLGMLLKNRQQEKLAGIKAKKHEETNNEIENVLVKRGMPKNVARGYIKAGPVGIRAAFNDSRYMEGMGESEQQPQQPQQVMEDPFNLQQRQQQVEQDPQKMQQEQINALQPQPQEASQPIDFSPDELKELRESFSNGPKPNKADKEKAKTFFKTMGIDDDTSEMLLGQTLNKKIARYFLKLAKGDPDKARKIAKSFGYNT